MLPPQDRLEIVKGSIAPEMARPVGYKGMYDMYEYIAEEDPMPETTVNLNVVGFFAMVSVSLAIFNLLPIPALDGGRILFALPEIIIRRRIPIEWQNAVNFVFFMALIHAIFLAPPSMASSTKAFRCFGVSSYSLKRISP